ncbi:MAG: B12-binding domain-containing radical SAM protein, partial [Candidatus Omnitrophica bacterium]|nr:B12-binding domain-containing radical SAM protein [Candidatus Omnitrophota bacterium]
ALLFPSWTGEYGIFSHFARKASVWPPLNLAYLAALAERAGHEVKIIDGEAESLSLQNTLEEVRAFGPDVIGITATTPFFHLAVELAGELKAADRSIPIIIGGHHVTVLKEKGFADPFDYAFIGEAEVSWPEFLKRFERKQDISTVKGILFRSGSMAVFTGAQDKTDDIDAIPLPARHLLKMDRYVIGTMRGKKKFTTIMTTRGCPFKCVFCSTDVFGSKVRRRDARSVIDEMKGVIADYDIRHFIFLDDTLTLDRGYILRICDLIEKEKLSVTFEGSTRANLVDDELISKMAKAGLIRLSFGLETVDPQIRRLIKKDVPLESYAISNRITNKYKIETLNSVMLGLPGETRETVGKTLAFLKTAREIHQANFSIATPYPGTELYSMAKNGEHGLRLITEDFSKYRRYGSAVMGVNDLSPDDLIELQNDGFVSIYSAPWRIMPMLRKSGLIGGMLTMSRILSGIWRKARRKR